MHKLERMIQKNLDLKIPMKYEPKEMRKTYLPYYIPTLCILLISISIFMPKQNKNDQTQIEDNIVINLAQNEFTTLDVTTNLKSVFILKEIEQNKAAWLDFMIPNWKIIYEGYDWYFSYKIYDSSKEITLLTGKNIIMPTNFTLSNIQGVPAVIIQDKEFFSKSLYVTIEETTYLLSTQNIEEDVFLDLSKQLIHYLKEEIQ